MFQGSGGRASKWFEKEAGFRLIKECGFSLRSGRFRQIPAHGCNDFFESPQKLHTHRIDRGYACILPGSDNKTEATIKSWVLPKCLRQAIDCPAGSFHRFKGSQKVSQLEFWIFSRYQISNVGQGISTHQTCRPNSGIVIAFCKIGSDWETSGYRIWKTFKLAVFHF